jgi:type II secretory pathway pseudopilin PulG
MKKHETKLAAFSLVEILVALGIFVIMMSSVVFFSVDARRALQNTRKRVEASLQLEKTLSSLTLYKYNNWANFISNTDQGSKGIQINGNNLEITENPIEIDDITIGFEVTSAYRDGTGNLAESGTLDLHTRKVTVTASWQDFANQNHTIDTILYINDWNTSRWLQTAESEFNQGTTDLTFVTNTDDGEVQLETTFYANWCRPELTINTYDIPGQGDAKTVYAVPHQAYLGTGGNASGVAFTKLDITGYDPPVVNVAGQFDQYKVNAVAGDGNYAYLATDSNNSEVAVIQISSLPYSEVAYFDAPGNRDADSIEIKSGVGFIGQAGYLRTFDISTPSGSLSLIGEIDVVRAISQIKILDDYAYITHTNGTVDLTIVDISDPANMSIVGTSDFTSENVNDIHIREDGDRVYAVTDSITGPEFFVLDTTQKTGSRPVLGTYDSNGMDVKGVALSDEDNRAILIGYYGENYQVVIMDDETNPTRCGGMTLGSNLNDVQIVKDNDGNVFSYIMTEDTMNEFQIIRGGQGGGDANGNGYFTLGTFESSIFNTTNSNPAYFTLGWDATVPSGTSISFQIRTSSTTDFTGREWVGPDGTNTSYFTTSVGDYIPVNQQGNQYFQYKAILESDTVSTPIMNSVYLDYQ